VTVSPFEHAIRLMVAFVVGVVILISQAGVEWLYPTGFPSWAETVVRAAIHLQPGTQQPAEAGFPWWLAMAIGVTVVYGVCALARPRRGWSS
jgi:hypothetical protein